MFVLMQNGTADLTEIKNRYTVILGDYQISPQETALTVYTEGKNEWFLKKFLLSKAVAGCAQSTLRNYGNEIRRALTQIGKDADAITSNDVQILLAGIMQRTSKIYADNVRRDLSSFFSYLTREELIPKNPMNRVDKIKITKKKKLAFTEYEVELIRSACQNNRERAIVEVLLSTGCRVSELVGIRTEDIDTSAVNVLGKGDKYRLVYLNAKAMIAIKMYLDERRDANPYLFPKCSANGIGDAASGKMLRSVKGDWYKMADLISTDGKIDKGSIESAIRKIGRRAGVENCHPHRFRRTCATFALRRGMPIEQVSKMLGHANIATTQIYLDLTDADLEQSHRRYVV